MRREHVVIGGDNGEIGGGAGTQSLLLVSGARGKTMREIGTSERATVRPATPHRLDAAEIFFPRRLAARANTGRDIGDYSLHHLRLVVAAAARRRPHHVNRFLRSSCVHRARPDAIAAAGPQVPAR